MSSRSASNSKRRPGGRSARIRQAVLDAAFAELGEKGYGGLSIEAVALRSGVAKTTVYRRWPTRDELVADALDSRSDRNEPVPDTGSLRGDLKEFCEGVRAKLTSNHGKAMLKSLVAAVDQSPEITNTVERFWRERRDVGGHLIERWIRRGVMRPETDADVLVEAILAPIYLRVLLPGGPLTGDVLERFIDLALDGVLEDVAPGRTITDKASATASDATGVERTGRVNTT
ncbi:MAG: TetR/AcrR family transcriptional regulator [Chloroflexi bacterium]|nr:MAG: TetR/AcrR family transcriptional regulator [Chloroflexota bacterium]